MSFNTHLNSNQHKVRVKEDKTRQVLLQHVWAAGGIAENPGPTKGSLGGEGYVYSSVRQPGRQKEDGTTYPICAGSCHGIWTEAGGTSRGIDGRAFVGRSRKKKLCGLWSSENRERQVYEGE